MNKLLLALLLSVTGCNDASFSEDSTVKKVEKDAEERPTADAKTDPKADSKDDDDKTFAVPANCTADGVTNATLLTTSATNDSDDFIEYEIFVTDCEGKVKNVQADTILFDVNASSKGTLDLVSYEVQTKTREPVTSGVMDVIYGSDLFGVTKASYRHYKTASTVQFSVPSASFIFRVKLSLGRMIAVQNVDNPFMHAGDQNIETFLRFGKASPVTATVLFTNY